MTDELKRHWLDQAHHAAREGQWEAARQAYADVLDLDSRNEEAYLGIATTYLGLGQPGRARAMVQDYPKATDLQALASLLLGEIPRQDDPSPTSDVPESILTKALHQLQARLRDHPKQPAGWTWRAVVLYWLNRPSEAFASLAAALHVAPNYPLAEHLQEQWLGKILCLPAPGQVTVPDDAHSPSVPQQVRPEWYVEHLLGDNAEALYQKALQAWNQHDLTGAEEWLRRGMLVDPEHLESCRLRFEVLLQRDRPTEARVEGYHLMDRLERLDLLTEAVALGTRMHRLWPDDERLLRKHQLLFHRSGDVDQAARWTFELVRRHRYEQEFEKATAALFWLVRRPLSGADRLRAELLLLAILLASDRVEAGLDRLEVLLAQWEAARLAGERTYGRRAATVLRMLARTPADNPRVVPLQTQLRRLREG